MADSATSIDPSNSNQTQTASDPDHLHSPDPDAITFYKLFVPWMRWCAFFFAAVLLTVLGVTALLWREPDFAMRHLYSTHTKPLEVGAEERAQERLRNSHADLIERLFLVFGPADRDLVMRQFVFAGKTAGSRVEQNFLVGEESILWDLIREAKNMGSPKPAIALRLVADAVTRLAHLRKWFPHADATFLANRMLLHAAAFKDILPADLLLVVDLIGRVYVRIANAVMFYELRSVCLTSDMLLLRMLRLLRRV